MEHVLVGLINLCCFLAGVWAGCSRRGEKVRLPERRNISRERREKQQAQAQQERLLTVLQNIESYDGTPYGQKDV